MIARPSGPLDAPAWRRLFAFGLGAMVLLHVSDVFVRPWLMGIGDVVISDDARQFLTWMPRLVDPTALRGDWMADFWQAMSPPAYAALYRAGAAIGIAPLVMARLVSTATLTLSGYAAWRLARAMAPVPAVAFCAAAFLMALLSKEDSIFSATPRGLAVPAVLFFLEGLVRGRWLATALSGFALALLYPASGVTLVTMLALSRLRWHGCPRVEGGWSAVARVGATGVGMVLLVLLFREQAEGWGPALTLDQARHMPALMTPGARSTLVNEAGSIDYLCSMRSGYLPEIIPCGRGVPFALPANILFLLPLILLAVRGVRQGGPERIYACALVAGLVWFVLAWLVAFKLHLPSRFSQRILYPLEWLAIGQYIGEALVAARRGRAWRWGRGAVVVFLLVTFATPLALLRAPSDRQVVDVARAMPAGTRIGGVSDDLQFLPALAGRAITGSPQHAIPWQLGYYRRVREGLSTDLLLLSTADRATFLTVLERSGADYLLVPPTVLGGDLPDSYARVLPQEAQAARLRMTAAEPLLRTFAARCRLGRTDYLVSACLARAVRIHALDDQT